MVTGAASGIGEATVRHLRADGFTVVATDIDADAVKEVSPHSFALDVSDEAAVADVFARLLADWPTVDVLVNNAGISGSREATVAHTTPVDEFDRVLAVNVRGAFLCARAVLPAMLAAGRGQLITVASAAGLVAFPGRCAYTVSKGAAVQLARSLAVDYGSRGIRSNAVCPGMVHTPMTRWRLDDPTELARIESLIPIGRVASADEIADVIALIASGRMTYLNGAAVTVDGGWTSW